MEKHMTATKPCRMMRRALAMSLAPMAWATMTPKPKDAAPVSEPKSHVVESTMPTAAEASAPSRPTMEASIKNISVEVICANIEGILSPMMRASFSRLDMSFPSRMRERRMSDFKLLCVVTVEINKTDVEDKG